MTNIKQKIESFNQITGSNIDPNLEPKKAQEEMTRILRDQGVWNGGEYSKHVQELIKKVI